MGWEKWIADVAERLSCEPEDLEETYSQLRPLLYDAGASPAEAADYLRSGG